MVLIAIYVSRVEAVVVASMLRGYGIYCSIDGEAHASTEYLSLALGGHRLRVMSEDYLAACEILRASGANAPHELKRSRYLLHFLGIYVGMKGAILLAGGAITVMPWWLLALLPLDAVSIPVNPKGRADYFLSAPLEADDPSPRD